MSVKPIRIKAEFIKNDNGELILGIPSSDIVWKIYVLNKESLKKIALINSATT